MLHPVAHPVPWHGCPSTVSRHCSVNSACHRVVHLQRPGSGCARGPTGCRGGAGPVCGPGCPSGGWHCCNISGRSLRSVHLVTQATHHAPALENKWWLYCTPALVSMQELFPDQQMLPCLTSRPDMTTGKPGNHHNTPADGKGGVLVPHYHVCLQKFWF